MLSRVWHWVHYKAMFTRHRTTFQPTELNIWPDTSFTRDRSIEWFLYDLEMKTREQNRKNKQKEIERFDWFTERIQTRVAFGWLSKRSGKKTSCRKNFSRNQPILRFDVILQHDWPIEQCLLHIRVFFGGKTKSPCFDLFIHWQIKQITHTHRNQFSRSYAGNRSKVVLRLVWTEHLNARIFNRSKYQTPFL